MLDLTQKNWSQQIKECNDADTLEDELISIIDGRGKASLAGLGLGIQFTDMSDSKVRQAMENLAREAQGKIPATNNAFNMALSDRLQEIDFTALSEIAKMSVSDLVKHSSEIGDKVISGTKGAFDLVKNAKFVIPVTIVGYFLIREIIFRKKTR